MLVFIYIHARICPLLLAVQDRHETSPDQLGRLSGIDTGPDTGLSVVIYDRAGLLDDRACVFRD
jgi:hypothetical protein